MKVKKSHHNILKPVDKPEYGYWRALCAAFYSSKLYVDVAKRWRGFGLRYLFFVISLATIALSTRTIVQINTFIDSHIIYPISVMPPLNLVNGNLLFTEPMPYLIKNNKGMVVIAIDTTGVMTTIDDKQRDLTFLFTKDKMLLRTPFFQLFDSQSDSGQHRKIYTQKYTDGAYEVFVGKEWLQEKTVLLIPWLVDAFIYPIICGFFFWFYCIILFALAFLAQFIAHVIFKMSLPFKQVYRLLIVASTAQIVSCLLLLAADVNFANSGIFSMSLIAFYFSYALCAVRRDKKNLVLDSLSS